MFRDPNVVKIARAKPLIGKITPLAVPYKGMNARSPFAVMGPEYAISLVNVLCETFGVRSRKGYTEYARNLPSPAPVWTVMAYYPSTAADVSGELISAPLSFSATPFVNPGVKAAIPTGVKLFAAQGGGILDVTAGGFGPFVAMAGVSALGDFWTSINFQNTAGHFLLACEESGGYAIYNGTIWTMPVMGGGAGEISGADPALFNFIMEWKRRVWFVEKDSTRAWYLPVEQVTGAVTSFDFGAEFAHGGHLVSLASWTVDAGNGIDDRLVAVGSQGDVTIYEGTDPNVAANFRKIGTWYIGPLPVGNRQMSAFGGDVHILSQFGITPVSRLQATQSLAADSQQHLSFLIDPLLARLMQTFAGFRPWQILSAAREELVLVGVPPDASQYGGAFFSYKVTTQSWTILNNTTYTHLVAISNMLFAGTQDGRIVRAFNGPLDNVPIGATVGEPIICQVTPAYQPMGDQAFTKRFPMVRPTFLTTLTPVLKLIVLVDYGVPRPIIVPTLPEIIQSLWDEALWDQGKWSGLQSPIKEWLGATGSGFAATVQLDYACGGDTLLTSIDFWSIQGGVM